MSIQTEHTAKKEYWRDYFRRLGYIPLPRRGKSKSLGFRPDLLMFKADVPFGGNPSF
jgi:hypothetical protein